MSSTRATPVNGSVSQALVTVPCLYRGFSFRESGGTAAVVVTLYDNSSAASGTVLDSIPLAAGGAAGDFYDSGGTDGGIRCVNGIYVALTGTGTVVGSVRTN